MNSECNNCEYWKDHYNPDGRPHGECLKTKETRYCTDYCHRWTYKGENGIQSFRRGNVTILSKSHREAEKILLDQTGILT